MKAVVNVRTEVEFYQLTLLFPNPYGTEVLPESFPCNDGEMVRMTVVLDAGRILEWPMKGWMSDPGDRESEWVDPGNNAKFDLHVKVRDEGEYGLVDSSGKSYLITGDYVPDLIPGSYGDYIEFSVDRHGNILDWNPTSDQLVDFLEKANAR